MNATFKSVEFAYPSSTNAECFGYRTTGCWTVDTRAGINGIPKARCAYPTREEAIAVASSLPHEWHPTWLRFRADWL